MLAFAVRRFLGLVLTLAVMSAAIFLIMDVLPGDPAAIQLGTSARPDTLAALRQSMGLDQPAVVRYLAWMVGMARGDFGTSFTYGVPVAGLIAERLAVTVPLALMAIAFSTLIALPLGVIAAARSGSAVDYGASLFAQVCVAVPNFWIGLLLILLFSTQLGWFPAGGFPGWSAGIGAGLKALLLPAIALALPQSAILARVTRSAVLDVLNEDFVATARAKGLTRRAALWRHVVPNALVPVVTILGLQFSFLIAGAVLVENVFVLPGLGRLAFQALAQRDLLVIRDVVLLFAGLVVVVNFLVDMAYLALDPRLRGRG
ncbi:peptide/opine/nickel uptake family ABC transporter permease [Azorhizobium caulinodans ORS 571]|uniref:Peptide/opine/nickel uptake family ABC transporter permease n=1 Tax=Azorhizobium caulinodans (strain ATCC 43989 / DSM 5975 / JCM 20966 / LMG 6465 / NBRC 14845 / NCIMB 13405 / ORS 571) TaxID=438753 RepID=A8I8S1_AZOC5|nr:ABC transporter permease [Azorhizobium caulinodans]BAF88695.1 peptide/opine/nickel uptake family ABC transporter permease [Azorhizobium caulinodans ORS 571]